MAERGSLRLHEPLGLYYRWPPTAGDAHLASQAPHQVAELMRILSVDSEGDPVWSCWEDLAGELVDSDIDAWAAESGADKYFREPELDEVDRERNRRAMEIRGEIGPGDISLAVDAKAYGRLSEYQRMVVVLSMRHGFDPASLLSLDYVLLRGLLAKGRLDAAASEATRQGMG